MDSSGRIAALRRFPTTCLYCSAQPDSNEHVLAAAIGGRLTAPILCRTHNNVVAASADKPFTDHFAPLTYGSSVRRSNGTIGTSLTVVDVEGRRARLNANGYSEYAVEVNERDEKGVAKRASGALRGLKAIAKNHPDPNGFRLFEVVQSGITIPICVGLDGDTFPGFVKTALHFAAGFVKQPPEATIASLRPTIFAKHPAPVLVQPPFREPYFNPRGPIRHEVTVYPHGEDAIVSIMLFSAIIIAVRLPRFGTRMAIRYIQGVDGSPPELVEVEPILFPERKLSDREWDGVLACAAANIERIFRERSARDVEEMAQEAARVALGHAARLGPQFFASYFRAELERRALAPAIVDGLVRQAAAHVWRGNDPFDVRPFLIR